MPNELIRTVNNVKLIHLTFCKQRHETKTSWYIKLALTLKKFDSQIFLILTEYQISGRENVEELVYTMHHCKEWFISLPKQEYLYLHCFIWFV